MTQSPTYASYDITPSINAWRGPSNDLRIQIQISLPNWRRHPSHFVTIDPGPLQAGSQIVNQLKAGSDQFAIERANGAQSSAWTLG